MALNEQQIGKQMLGLFSKIPFLNIVFGISASDRKMLCGKLVGIWEDGTWKPKAKPWLLWSTLRVFYDQNLTQPTELIPSWLISFPQMVAGMVFKWNSFLKHNWIQK